MRAFLVLPFLVACWGALGLAVLAALDAVPSRPWSRLVSGLAIGMGLCGMLGLGLAAAGQLRPLPLAGVAVVALALGGRRLVSTVGALEWRMSRSELAWVGIAALVLVTVLITYAAPPVGGDQTKYQLAYPRLYAAAGGLIPSSSVWGHQQFVQNFVYAIGFALGGELLARLLIAVTAILATLTLGLLVSRHLRPGAGVAAAVVFFTWPMTWSQMSSAGSDMAVVFFGLLAVSAVLDWQASRDAGDLRRAALAAGCAGGSKVLGLLIPTLVGLAVLLELFRRHETWSRTVGQAVTYGALVLAICTPFYLRNFVDTGNPLFPFGYGALGGREWSAEASDYLDHYYDEYQTTWAAKRGGVPYHGLGVWRFPWDLTMHPESFERATRQTMDVSPFALAFTPAVLLIAGRRRRAAWTVAAIGLSLIGIIAGGAWPHPRYVLPGIVLCFAAAIAGAHAALGRRTFAAVTALTVFGNLALTTKLMLPMEGDRARVMLGRMSTAQFMEKYSTRWVFWHAANPIVGDGGRVLVLEKIPHPYYIDTPFVMASYLEQGRIDYRRLTYPAQLATVARDLGITHVAVDLSALTASGDPYEAQVAALWSGFVTTECDKVLDRAGFGLYALRSVGEGRRG